MIGVITFMDLRLLEYFLAVCKELHFTRAAEKLGISQPTLSQQISILESRIGTKLFKRIGKKITITKAGNVLLEHAQQIFHELRQAESKINELNGLKRGNLTIGCSGTHLLTNAVISFHQKYPGIHLSLLEMPTEETKKKLLIDELDIGVVFQPVNDERFNTIPLFEEEFFLVVSEDSEMVIKNIIKLDELKDLPFILLTKQYVIRQFLDQDCEKKGFKLEPIIELSTLDALLHMVSLNIGATILPSSFLERSSKMNIKKIPIAEPNLKKDVALIYRKDVYLDQSIKAFVRHLTTIWKIEMKNKYHN